MPLRRVPLLVLGWAVVAPPGRAADDGPQPARHALICTVGRYYTTSLKVLDRADLDGAALTEVLVAAGWKVTALHTEPGRATATRHGLRTAMGQVERQCRPGDTLLFVFVGH